MEDKEMYYNFPIHLLKGFLINSKECMDEMMYYAVYAQSLKIGYEDPIKSFRQSEKDLKIRFGDLKTAFEVGKELYEGRGAHPPMVGIKYEIFWDYYKNHKTEFDKVCLLGFLALRSILQKKTYCKIDNKFWLSRMAGMAKSIPKDDLHPSIGKYFNEYQTKKIKSELENNWKLTTYSRYTRGFYVSFKMTLEQLIYEAEKRRKSTIEKQKKFSKQLALERVLERIENESKKEPP